MRGALLSHLWRGVRAHGVTAAAGGFAVAATTVMTQPQEHPLLRPLPAVAVRAWTGAALCEGAAAAQENDCCEDSEHAYPQPPPKLDDPEYNAQILASWRGHIQTAKELFARLDIAGAERELQIALEEAHHFGQSSGPVATSLLNLAQLYRRAARHAEAEPLLERAADVLEQTAGPNNKVTLLALIDLAATQLELGKPDAATEVYKDALARLDIAEANQPHGKHALREVRAGCLFHMARALSASGDRVAAETKLRDSLALVEERHGVDSRRLLAPCAELARVLTLQVIATDCHGLPRIATDCRSRMLLARCRGSGRRARDSSSVRGRCPICARARRRCSMPSRRNCARSGSARTQPRWRRGEHSQSCMRHAAHTHSSGTRCVIGHATCERRDRGATERFNYA